MSRRPPISTRTDTRFPYTTLFRSGTERLMATIRPADLPEATTVPSDAAIIIDTGSTVQKATPQKIVDVARPIASQTEAEGGADNAKAMTPLRVRSEEHTSELQSLMRISYAVFCLKKTKNNQHNHK